MACCPIGTKCSAGDPHDWPAHSRSSPAVFSLLGFRIIWGVLHFYFICQISCNPWFRVLVFVWKFLPAFSFLLFNFCKFCPFVTAIIQNFVSTNEGKEIVQLKEEKKKTKRKKFQTGNNLLYIFPWTNLNPTRFRFIYLLDFVI